ncbi:MAG TPA: MFS transporter [Acidobacteriaceae bacterium]|nr:MFS transporter [Acidobacteriaceae bacterium]
MNGIYSWFTEAPPEQKRAVLAAFLGWMLDGMDVMLYAMVLGQVQRAMHLSAAMSGAMMSATLVSAAAGGIGFGWFADRFGRTRALTISMLVYSVATALCGVSQTAIQLLFCRTVLGLGMGGEWAAGAALVAETWPTQHRAKALALVQSSWAIGYALAAAVVAVVMPRFGWRPVFFVGIIPALLTLWLRRNLREPEAWREIKTAKKPIRAVFDGSLGYNVLICAAMNTAALFAYWGLFTWMPRFLGAPINQGGRGLSAVQTSAWTIVMQIATFVGCLSFGYFADRFNRKYAYIIYLVAPSLLVPIFSLVRSPGALLFIGPLIGFFGTGNFSGFSVITSELFPTSVRGAAMGFVYNIGRVVSAGAPYLVGHISEHAGLGYALSTTSAAFLLAAIIATTLRLPSRDATAAVSLLP